MGTANDGFDVSKDPGRNSGECGDETSVDLFERLRDLVGRSRVRPQPGAGEESAQASIQPRLPGMETC